jgi:hypothetical protein
MLIYRKEWNPIWISEVSSEIAMGHNGWKMTGAPCCGLSIMGTWGVCW